MVLVQNVANISIKLCTKFQSGIFTIKKVIENNRIYSRVYISRSRSGIQGHQKCLGIGIPKMCYILKNVGSI